MARALTFILLMLCVSGFSQQNDCVLRIQSDDIQVYTCKSEKAKFRSLEAKFTIKNTTLDELVTFLKNVNNYPTWQYNMVSAELLLQETDTKMIIRSEINAPWPVTNRELIVEHSFKKNPALDQLNIIIQTVSYNYPLAAGLVRIPFSHAEWFVIKDGSDLKVAYTLHIDPGGSVPAWLVNLAMAEGPYESFRNLKAQLE